MSRLDELCNATIDLPQDKLPGAVLVTYSLCLSPPERCGWGGWILEGVFASAKGDTGLGLAALPCKTDQVCPSCTGELFRMENQYVFTPEHGRETIEEFMQRSARR